ATANRWRVCCLEQLAQLLSGDAGDAQNRAQGPSLEISIVDWDRKRPMLVGVHHDVMTAAYSIELPTLALEEANELAGLEAWELVGQPVRMTTRSRSPVGTLQPRSRMVSR